ncbi:SDR family NAD(P)-dependent oxidoreductase [Gemmata sp. G18]|uniref:SDR family NAD(P)-dependent oxidoreductase n=1 Tax=Gemmata palustris TaxID=2822762 RepID=A0ABS5BTC5_9BACT|nr:SDR family NAD(P)-dependent oxidoreductase [Gemmata palustris]MBP3956973.1 SDR family NAD(P)-dependent oxidoreductase [Gemmata palustris]
MRVAGRRVLVTGAGQGLGFAISAAFVRAGATVILTDLNADAVESARAKLKETGGTVAGYALDVTNAEQVADVRARILAEHGRIDVLVNNAGVVFGGAFLDVPLAHHIVTANVNLGGVLAVTHAFLPDLLAQPAGHIVNIASASAVLALPFGASYAATKWAVLGFSDSLREELRFLGHKHVHVTAMCPSFIATGLFAGAKPAFGTHWLTAETVAHAVVRAVEKQQELVLLPRSVRFLYSITGWWPRSWFRAACRVLGVSRSMTDWKGHTPPK